MVKEQIQKRRIHFGFLRLQGGSMLYAIFISLLMTGSASCLILFKHLSTKIQIQRDGYIKNVLDLKSAVEIGCSDYFSLDEGFISVVPLSPNSGKDVTINSKPWGMFNVITSSMISTNKSMSKSAMIGNQKIQKSSVALYLADRNQSLSMAGNSKIVGCAVLPKSGIKRAYIEGTSFTGIMPKVLNEPSNNYLPELNSQLITTLKARLMGNFPNDSLIIDSEINGVIYNPWSFKTLVLYNTSEVNLEMISIIGNVIIYSEESITVNNCTFKHTQLIAPMVHIGKQNKGSTHILAQDSIFIAPGSVIDYPSGICLLNYQQEIQTSKISIGNGSQINADIFLIDQYPNYRKRSRLGIETECRVTGQVYAQGEVVLKGTIDGCLYCESFVLETSSSKYQNHLYNATISKYALPENYLSSNMLKTGTKKIIQWLE